MSTEIVGIGGVVLDHVVRLDRFPDNDSKNPVREHWFQVGGPVPTALIAAIRLGDYSAAFLGVWGQDAHGCRITEDLDRYGVKFSASRRDSDVHSAFAHIWVDAEGRRTIAYDRGAFERLTPEEARTLDLSACRLLHLDGEHAAAAVETARRVRQEGGKVILDAGSPKPGSEELIPLADILVVSKQCARDYLGVEDSELAGRLFLERGARSVLLTRGDEGAWFFGDGKSFHQPAFAVEAVDTAGAGDVFCGGLIHALLSGQDMPGAVRYASAVAALKCEHRGNRASLPDAARVEAFLGRHAATLKPL